ncbi:MAG: hypothetical protein JW840_05440 [Candidatus Thermoplasmatota archaeon]|nr:hypothetical protein [Candidatus Thermoplasmatota archaeon]
MRKKRKVFGLLAMIIVLLLMSGCTQQNQPASQESLQIILEKATIIESVSYDLDISMKILDSVTQTTTIRIWQQLPYLKEQSNTTAGNITTAITIIKRPEGFYRYDEVLQSYVYDGQVMIPQPSLLEISQDLLANQSLTIRGTEDILGKTATVIEYTPVHMGNDTIITLWVWNEKGVPLKAEHTTSNEEFTVTMEYIYSNYSFEEIPQSIFAVE